MQVFFSWSGPRSKAVAGVLAKWLPRLINAVDPWISTRMEKGIRGGEEIADALEVFRFGIICLTRDNLKSPWILFEAGALSKTKNARVCTFLLDLTPGDVEQPLGQFQHTVATRDDVLAMVRTINNVVRDAGERALTDAVLEEEFVDRWPKFEAALATVPSAAAAPPAPVRENREVLEEILGIVRQQQRQIHNLEIQSMARQAMQSLSRRIPEGVSHGYVARVEGVDLEAATPALERAERTGILTRYHVEARPEDPPVLRLTFWSVITSPSTLGSLLRRSGLTITRIQRIGMPGDGQPDEDNSTQVVLDISDPWPSLTE